MCSTEFQEEAQLGSSLAVDQNGDQLFVRQRTQTVLPMNGLGRGTRRRRLPHCVGLPFPQKNF
jgi:hypothetical protein